MTSKNTGKKRKTKRKATIRKESNAHGKQTYWVVVEYSGHDLSLDEDIEVLAKKYGLKETGAGFGSGIRDISFESKKTDLKTMLSLIKKLRGELVRLRKKPKLSDFYPMTELLVD